ncbi:MAG TPA: rRNA maturation RNase YbeY [Gammaproteobacteria bacterium]|nr:rRNA maturation RNase YbeY [Gammaproteobacteria bacterium]
MSPSAPRLLLDLQQALERPRRLPSREEFESWVRAALAAAGHRAGELELTIRIVEAGESARLNERYRRRAGATNVLSFPFHTPPGVELPLLGDLVICAQVVEREAQQQGKDPAAHWAHMVVHGVLHLLGHDHTGARQAREMEALEIAILAGLGYDNPY